MAVTKYILLISAFLIVGVLMNPLNSNHASTNSDLSSNNLADKNGDLQSLLDREAALLNLKKKLSQLKSEKNADDDDDDDDVSSIEELNTLLNDQDLEDLADALGDNDYVDGKVMSKKSAPRRIFIGNLKYF
jgi:hypothetical protein